MVPREPMATRFSPSRARLWRAAAACSRASGWPPLSTSTSGSTAPQRTIRTLFSFSKDKLTIAATALIWTAVQRVRRIERREARRRGLQSLIRQSRLSLVAWRREAAANSCSLTSESIHLVNISSSHASVSISEAGDATFGGGNSSISEEEE
ncbi:hypothetical protein MUK42_37014 [Musa troglodytarum]|uniref:Uncharacterized protein n=1 Tax=Musa troglodytarum TaxID=320322 RepID=A0A9E7KVB6_9LILI|nr:hypothetical protein MUK42_37014 [Musa troglodytarum]